MAARITAWNVRTFAQGWLHRAAATARLLLTLACIWLAQSACAQPGPPQYLTDAYIAGYPEVQQLLARNEAAAALKLLQREQSLHENDPAYFNLAGVIALKARDFVGAQAALERVVLMQPENAGAWMDLALAATEAGNLASASSYFNYIEAEFNPPAEIRAVIAGYRARIASPPLSSYGLSMQAELLLGVDSNANSGLQNSFIPLTIGSERIELPLDASSQARADRFVQVAAGGMYRNSIGLGLLELGLTVRQRRYLVERDFSTLEATLGAGLRNPTRFGAVNFGAQTSHLSLGGAPLLRTMLVLAQLERPFGPCRAGVSAEWEARRYFVRSTLDANLQWGQLGLGCNWALGSVPVTSAVIARSGIDRPTGERAGGRTRHSVLTLQLGAPLVWGVTADFNFTVARAADSEGYSPLLEQFAARTIDRRSTRLALMRPLGGGADVVVSWEENRMLSNLALFRQSGRVLGVAVRKGF